MEFLNDVIASMVLVKIGFLILDFLYVIFLLIVYNQVSSMDKIIAEPNTPVIKFISIINIFFAAFLFIIAVVIL